MLSSALRQMTSLQGSAELTTFGPNKLKIAVGVQSERQVISHDKLQALQNKTHTRLANDFNHYSGKYVKNMLTINLNHSNHLFLYMKTEESV